jgi:hypothetical protein
VLEPDETAQDEKTIVDTVLPAGDSTKVVNKGGGNSAGWDGPGLSIVLVPGAC